jgi:hypothetical protein
MTGERRAQHSFGGLFAFVLVGLFALLALLIVATGIRAYRGMGDLSRQNGQARAALGYVSGKLRTAGDAQRVTLRAQQGIDLIVIEDQLDSDVYETRIFFVDGALKEQFCEAAMPFDPEDGQLIAALPALTFERRGDLIWLRAQLTQGRPIETCVALRAGEGGGPDAL